jgi:hypothetical protein
MSCVLRLSLVVLLGLCINKGYSQSNDNRAESQSATVALTGILTLSELEVHSHEGRTAG